VEVVNSNSQDPRTLGPVGTRRSYRQLCGLASALDVVGERWTMLVIRDLVLGPRRYSELLDGLPGIGEGLLAQRLRHLEGEGLVRRTFSASVGAVVYELTDDGEDLWKALVPLARWGLQRVGNVADAGTVKADHLALSLRTRFDASRSAGLHEQYELRIDDEPYTVTADDGTVTVMRGAAPDAAVHATLDLDTMLEIGMGTLSIAQAREAGRTKVVGKKDAVERYTKLLRERA
jgi:DNA-binding HxlR family transcriptional regulator/putative sterol carrier protein